MQVKDLALARSTGESPIATEKKKKLKGADVESWAYTVVQACRCNL